MRLKLPQRQTNSPPARREEQLRLKDDKSPSKVGTKGPPGPRPTSRALPLPARRWFFHKPWRGPHLSIESGPRQETRKPGSSQSSFFWPFISLAFLSRARRSFFINTNAHTQNTRMPTKILIRSAKITEKSVRSQAIAIIIIKAARQTLRA